jgi:hypothetical protein
MLMLQIYESITDPSIQHINGLTKKLIYESITDPSIQHINGLTKKLENDSQKLDDKHK